MFSETDGILALLILLIVAVIWLTVEVQKVRAAVEPIATSRLVETLARV
jgi:hypothetical protein